MKKLFLFINMNNIIFYSNYCENSKKVLTELSKTQMKEELYYICIDKRTKHPNGAIYIILENGQEIMMPPAVTAVPCLLMINEGHKTIMGEEIIQYFQPKQDQLNNAATLNNGDPLAFSFGSLNTGVSSDNYSFWDMSSDDLSAKGSGGLRQMYNYATPEYANEIDTPEDKAVANTIGKEGMTMDKIMAKRDEDVNKLVNQQQFNTR
jgi:hypothetical protein